MILDNFKEPDEKPKWLDPVIWLFIVLTIIALVTNIIINPLTWIDIILNGVGFCIIGNVIIKMLKQ